jgi:peptidoglycan/xylan/chitin deacetylase (PgdA/CDA1 family)
MGDHKPGRLIIIWDYDGAAGNLNASYPYKFDESKLYREIDNVDRILYLGSKFGLRMTFACVGFGAEPGVQPYHIQNQIRSIRSMGHEIASHSWRHEWFPYLEKRQIECSLERSKEALETCIEEPGAVFGFVLPFSRPMSWAARGAFSLGDRVFGPWYPGADLGSILRFVGRQDYRWMRISYRPIWQKVFPKTRKLDLNRSWETYRKVVLVPSHVFGFAEEAQALLTQLSQEGGNLVVSAHPAAMSFGREESLENFEAFLNLFDIYRSKGLIESITVKENIS